MKAKRGGVKGKKKVKSPTARGSEMDQDLLKMRSKEMLQTMHWVEDEDERA